MTHGVLKIFPILIALVTLYGSFYAIRRYTSIFDPVLGTFTFQPLAHDPQTWLSPFTGTVERKTFAPARAVEARIRFRLSLAEDGDNNSGMIMLHYAVPEQLVAEISGESKVSVLEDDLNAHGVSFPIGSAFSFFGRDLSMINTAVNHKELQKYLEEKSPDRWRIVGHDKIRSANMGRQATASPSPAP